MISESKVTEIFCIADDFCKEFEAEMAKNAIPSSPDAPKRRRKRMMSNSRVILDIPADVLREDIADRSTDVSKAYRRGKAASKVKLHSQEMMLAQVGSPLAIENAHRNLLDMEDDE